MSYHVIPFKKQFSSPELLSEIFGTLSLPKKINQPPFNRPLKRTLSIVQQNDATFMIVTKNHEDKEYSSEYQYLAAKGKKPPSKYTTRFDFFSSPPPKQREGNIKQFLNSVENIHYLGYVILRPQGTIYRSVVEPPRTNDSLSYFVKCISTFPSGLRKQNDLVVTGFPFYQKSEDEDIVCVHACLKMICSYYKNAYGKPPIKISDIKEKINHHSGEKSTDLGDIKETLISLGYGEPFSDFFWSKKFEEKQIDWDLMDEINDNFHRGYEHIYTMIESGMPPLIALKFTGKDSGHAIVGIGHTFDQNAWWPEADLSYYYRPSKILPTDRYLSSAAWTDLIIHDDNFGPYLVFSPSKKTWLDGFVAPKKSHSIPAHHIEEEFFYTNLTLSTLKEEKEMLSHLNKMKSRSLWGAEFYRHLVAKHPTRLILRSYMCSIDEFLDNFQDGALKEFYKKMPKLLWVTELSIPEVFSNNRSRLGEIIADPTMTRNKKGNTLWADLNKVVMSIHLPYYLLIPEWKKGPRAFKLYPIKNYPNYPYKHLISKI